MVLVSASVYLTNQYPFTIHRFKRLTLQTIFLLFSIPAHAAQYLVVAVSEAMPYSQDDIHRLGL